MTHGRVTNIRRPRLDYKALTCLLALGTMAWACNAGEHEADETGALQTDESGQDADDSSSQADGESQTDDPSDELSSEAEEHSAEQDEGNEDSDAGSSSDTDASGSSESGDTADSSDTLDDTDDTDDTDETGIDCDDVPPPDPEWITAFQEEHLAKLTGATEISPGTTLSDRSSSANRDAARDYLVSVFEGLDIEVSIHDYGSGGNVWGQLDATEGSESAETVLVGAHFDSVSGCPGANDDGTGTVLVLALAKHMANYPCRTRNLAFVLFDEEERGLLGSKAFAGKVSDENWNIHSVHTIDQMGWDSNGDRLVEIERPGNGLLELYEQAVMDLGVSIPILETDLWQTDFSSFQPKYEAMGLTEGYKSGDTTPHYHKPSDKYDTVNFEYLRSSTVLVHHVIGGLAFE